MLLFLSNCELIPEIRKKKIPCHGFSDFIYRDMFRLNKDIVHESAFIWSCDLTVIN